MKTVKISPQNFTVWYQLTNQVYGRFCSINFRTLHLVISLRTVKFCRHFFHFSFFLLSNFLAKTTKNTVKHEKLPYVRKNFRKLDPFFFPEIPKFALFWGGGGPQLSGATHYKVIYLSMATSKLLTYI